METARPHVLPDAIDRACREGDAKTVLAWVDAGNDVNLLNDIRQSLLALTVFRDLPDLGAALLARGADPNRGDWPAILHAVHAGSLPWIDALLAHGANPDASTADTHALYEALLLSGGPAARWPPVFWRPVPTRVAEPTEGLIFSRKWSVWVVGRRRATMRTVRHMTNFGVWPDTLPPRATWPKACRMNKCPRGFALGFDLGPGRLPAPLPRGDFVYRDRAYRVLSFQGFGRKPPRRHFVLASCLRQSMNRFGVPFRNEPGVEPEKTFRWRRTGFQPPPANAPVQPHLVPGVVGKGYHPFSRRGLFPDGIERPFDVHLGNALDDEDGVLDHRAGPGRQRFVQRHLVGRSVHLGKVIARRQRQTKAVPGVFRQLLGVGRNQATGFAKGHAPNLGPRTGELILSCRLGHPVLP